MFVTKFVINRPLFFLCGPYIGSGDVSKRRRVLLAKYLLEIGKVNKEEFRPLPIIVDELFDNSKEIKELGLDMTLLEEIVANISSNTYIFLDTLSTSYELGLFANSKQNNEVCIFLEKDFKNREKCPVGEYILLSQESKVINYEASRDENGFISFVDDLIPEEIKKQVYKNVDVDFINRIQAISFEKVSTGNKECFGKILYEYVDNKLIFRLDIKTIFYFLGCFLNDTKYIFSIEGLSDIYIKLKKEIMSTFCLLNTDKTLLLNLIFSRNDVSIINSDYDIDVLLKNMCYIISMMKNHVLSCNNNALRNPFSKPEHSWLPLIKLSEVDFFGLTIDDLLLSKDYIKKKDYYTNKLVINIKGKKRLVITYANNKKGRLLREKHQLIEYNLRRYLPTSANSYAYKENNNTLNCIKRHLDSNYFYKFDVHHFFESISLSKLEYKFYRYFSEKRNLFLNSIGIFYLYDRFFEIKLKNIRMIINLVMYNYRLSVGFVTSPIISDYFLNDLDEKMSNNDSYIYTRYADDILISSNLPFDNPKHELINLLKKEDLTLNEKKSKSYSLINIGDSVKFLGIVLCKASEKNILKISNSYIRNAYIQICDYVNKYKMRCLPIYEKIIGKLKYIKYISEESYIKLHNLCMQQLGISIDCLPFYDKNI